MLLQSFNQPIDCLVGEASAASLERVVRIANVEVQRDHVAAPRDQIRLCGFNVLKILGDRVLVRLDPLVVGHLDLRREHREVRHSSTRHEAFDHVVVVIVLIDRWILTAIQSEDYVRCRVIIHRQIVE